MKKLGGAFQDGEVVFVEFFLGMPLKISKSSKDLRSGNTSTSGALIIECALSSLFKSSGR